MRFQVVEIRSVAVDVLADRVARAVGELFAEAFLADVAARDVIDFPAARLAFSARCDSAHKIDGLVARVAHHFEHVLISDGGCRRR